MSVPVGTTQLYFDKTFQGANVEIEAVYASSLILNAKAKFQNATVKMLTMFLTFDKNAASKRLTKEDIKQREMEVLVSCEQNKFFRVWGEVNVLCQDGNIYSVNAIMLLMTIMMDHQATEQHCFKTYSPIEVHSFKWKELDVPTKSRCLSLRTQPMADNYQGWQSRTGGGTHSDSDGPFQVAATDGLT